MYKVGATALSMTLLVGSLAGCGKKDAEPSVEETTLAAETADATSAEAKETENASTAAPVTTEPTTVVPTTVEPTTEEPTTEEPTTEEPTTEEELVLPDPNRDPSEVFSELEQEILEYRIGNNYYLAVSTMERPEDYGFTRDKLTDYTTYNFRVTDKENKTKAEKKLKAKLDAINYDGLTDAQKLAYDKLQYDFDIDARMREQAELASPIAPNDETRGGIFAFIGALYELPLKTEEDLIGYQKLLEAVPKTLQDALDFMQYQLDEYGYNQLPEKVRAAAENAVAIADPEDNILLTSYEEKVRAMDLPEETKEAYIRQNEEYLCGPLKDALMKFSRDIQKFNSSSNKTRGLCYYEGGAEYYDVMVRKLLGVEMKPQEIFDYIEAHLKANLTLNQMYAQIKPEEYEAYEAFYQGKYERPYDPTSVTDIAAYYTTAMAKDYPMELLPAYEISEMPEILQGGSYNAYYVPARWGDTSPLVIRYDPNMSGFELLFDSVLCHEGLGGHMLQCACADENDKVSTMNNYKGYTEGWAEYVQCESSKYAGMSKELVAFRKLDLTFGQDLEALADLAVNGLGWSKDDLYEYLDKYGVAKYDAQQVYDRVIARPGYSLPYSFGEKKTLDLMDAYKRAHADDLDVKEMHRKYMSIGTTSFDIVEKYFLGE